MPGKTRIFRVSGVVHTIFGEGSPEWWDDFYHRADRISEEMKITNIESLPRTGDDYRFLVSGE